MSIFNPWAVDLLDDSQTVIPLTTVLPPGGGLRLAEAVSALAQPRQGTLVYGLNSQIQEGSGHEKSPHVEGAAAGSGLPCAQESELSPEPLTFTPVMVPPRR